MKRNSRLYSLFVLIICLACLVGCKPTGTPQSSTIDSGVTSTLTETSTTPSQADSSSDSSKSMTTQREESQVTKRPTSSRTQTQSTTPPVLTKTQFNFSTPGLPGSRSKELLNNPDRGFRLEVYINASDGGWYPANDRTRSAIEHTKDQIAQYASDSPGLAQTYVYLTDYYNKDLDKKALDNIQNYFDFLDSNGIKMLLRFAYEYDEKDKVRGPTTAQILRHLEQLKPLMEKNKGKIYVVQAAFIGLWGEWHHAINVPPSDYKRILEAIVDATPKELFVQVRMVSYKNILDKNDSRRARIGYHDDYLIGVKNSWNSGLVPGTDEWDQQTAESPFLLTDGEMPWGTDTMFVNYVDPYLMAKRLNLHCFGSLSLVHHYKEGGGRYSMARWKSEVTSAAKLNREGLPFASAWFLDDKGKTTDRSMFAYVRDYLGYYIEASQVKAAITGNKIKVDLNLTNYGFAAPNSMKQPELVILDKSGRVVSSAAICKTVDLQTKKTVSSSLTLELPSNPYGASVGIRFTNLQKTPAKLANNIPYQNGVNILGSLVNGG